MKSLEEALGTLLERIEVLGEVTDTPGALTRTFLSRANQEAAKLVGWWMAGAGMKVEHDAGGTVRGVLAGVPSDPCQVISGKAGEAEGEGGRREEVGKREAEGGKREEVGKREAEGGKCEEVGTREAEGGRREEGEEAASDASRLPPTDYRPLLLGSHIDTVIDAGKYDGALGVLIAIAALEVTGPLPFPVHVLGFSDEEGVRFHATYLGSRACVGPLDEELLEIRDGEGISLRQALEEARAGRLREGEQWRMDEEEDQRSEVGNRRSDVGMESHQLGAWRGEVVDFLYRPGECRGYVEVHIEQGRVLEELGEAVCAVSAICGQSRLMITLKGQTDHAGTTPMHLRKDALAGAAECVLAVERLARANEAAGLMATVGKLDASPGATNAIPGEVRFSLDFRHPDDAEKERLLEKLLGEFGDIAAARGLEAFAKSVQANPAVPCDPDLSGRLLDAVEPLTSRRHQVPSGAGHDGVMMSRAMPIAMLFVRCRAGLSHHPDEYASPGDIAVALRVLVDFLKSAG